MSCYYDRIKKMMQIGICTLCNSRQRCRWISLRNAQTFCNVKEMFYIEDSTPGIPGRGRSAVHIPPRAPSGRSWLLWSKCCIYRQHGIRTFLYDMSHIYPRNKRVLSHVLMCLSKWLKGWDRKYTSLHSHTRWNYVVMHSSFHSENYAVKRMHRLIAGLDNYM